jgi:hypothetical protein
MDLIDAQELEQTEFGGPCLGDVCREAEVGHPDSALSLQEE